MVDSLALMILIHNLARISLSMLSYAMCLYHDCQRSTNLAGSIVGHWQSQGCSQKVILGICGGGGTFDALQASFGVFNTVHLGPLAVDLGGSNPISPWPELYFPQRFLIIAT